MPKDQIEKPAPGVMVRAYSTLKILSFDDSEGVIEGIASTPETDRYGDRVIPEGAQYKLPIPLLWQHNAGNPIGSVEKVTITKDGIRVVARVALGVTDEIDKYWKLIKAGLVRGLSIGFMPIKVADIAGSWASEYLEWDWLELSAVTIPANADASIVAVKHFANRGASSGRDPQPKGSAGVAAGAKSTQPKGQAKMTHAQMIASLEAKRQAKAAQMEAILTKSADAGETTDAAGQQEFDDLSLEVDQIDSDLRRYRSLERIQGSAAKPVNGVSRGADASQSRDPDAPARVPAQVRVHDALPKGVGFARIAKLKALSRLDNRDELELAREHYGENSDTFQALSAGRKIKAAVAAGTSISGNWAANLVSDETKVYADFLEYLRPMTILGKFGQGGIPNYTGVPFDTPLLSETGGGDAYWVGEGKPKPLTSFGYGRTSLQPLTVATICAVTEKLLRRSSVQADQLLRDSLASAVAARLDVDFIDPAKAASSGVSPASITNGVTPVASSGNDADAVRADIKAAMSAFIAANNLLTSGVWIMPATVALGLALMMNPLGQREFPDMTITGGKLMGLPVIVSEYVPTVSAGAYVTLVNARDVWVADEDGIAIDMSREASLQMSDAPSTQDATTGTGTSLVSMWQTNAVAFRAERFINWAKGRSTAVAVISAVNWGDEPASV